MSVSVKPTQSPWIESEYKSKMLREVWKDHLKVTSRPLTDMFPRDLAHLVAEYALEGCAEVLVPDALRDAINISVCDSEVWAIDAKCDVFSATFGKCNRTPCYGSNLLAASRTTALMC